jgi:hypothetical protein
MNITFHETKTATSNSILDDYEEQEDHYETDYSQAINQKPIDSTSPAIEREDSSKPTNEESDQANHKVSPLNLVSFGPYKKAQETSGTSSIAYSEKSDFSSVKNIFKPSNCNETVTNCKPWNNASYSSYNQKKSAPFPKLADLHKKHPSKLESSHDSSGNEPVQKKLKQVHEMLDDDFVISQEDLFALDQLK